MFNIIKFCIVLGFLQSCRSNQKSLEAINPLKDTALYKRDTLPNTIKFRPNYSLRDFDSSDILLSFFDTIPETIGNPATFYTFDTTKLSDKKFIFLTNSADYGIIRNNEKDIYLAKVHSKSKELEDNVYKEMFRGNGFTVICITKVTDSGNGYSYENGTLDIKNSAHHSIINIHGGYLIK